MQKLKELKEVSQATSELILVIAQVTAGYHLIFTNQYELMAVGTVLVLASVVTLVGKFLKGV